MRIWTDNLPVRSKPTASRGRLGRHVALILTACLLLPAIACAAGETAPAVMSNLRHRRFPTPDVPVCAPVEDDYFTGAVLVGDSTAEPFALHGVVPALETLSVIGISPRTAASDRLFTLDSQPCTLAEKLTSMQPSMVYLWLGSNGVDTKPADQVIADYDVLLNDLLAALPDTLFYLIELTPVKLIAQESYRNYTNERVDEFNTALREVAQRHNVYLLPVNSLLRNEKGLLDGEYGAGDGIHLRKAAYEILAAYLYTHTIPLEEGSAP